MQNIIQEHIRRLDLESLATCKFPISDYSIFVGPPRLHGQDVLGSISPDAFAKIEQIVIYQNHDVPSKQDFTVAIF